MGRSLQNGVTVVLIILIALCIFDVFLLPLVTSNHFYPVPEARQRNRSVAGGWPTGASGIAARLWLRQNLHQPKNPHKNSFLAEFLGS